MSVNTVRTQVRGLAVKIETTTGTDAIGAGPPVTADFIAATFDIDWGVNTLDNPEVNGAMETPAPIMGSVQPKITIRVPFRGHGTTAGAAPEWGRLMRACSYVETLTAVAVGAPTAIVSGTTTTLTLASPFGTTAQQYRGMPIVSSGGVNDGTSLVQDYTAGRVATLIETLANAPTTSQLVTIPANALYTPSSDDTAYKTVTIWAYEDGLLHKFVGCSGTWSLDMKAGEPGALTFEMQGILSSAYNAATLPSGWNATRKTPPLWINGKSQLGQATCRTAMLSYKAGVQLAMVENPESAQGWDAPVPSARSGALDIAPYASSSASPTRFQRFQSGTAYMYGAIVGTTAANRCAFLLPSGRLTKFDRSDRQNLGVDGLTLTPDSGDGSAILCAF